MAGETPIPLPLADVIESIVEEKGIPRDKVVEIVREGIASAYRRRYPEADFDIRYNEKLGEFEVFVTKKVVKSVTEPLTEISLRKARGIDPNISVGEEIKVPFDGEVTRVDILVARQRIAMGIREAERDAIFKEFSEEEGHIVAGVIHRQERFGWSVRINEVFAYLPRRNTIPGENFSPNQPVRALLKEVLREPKDDYQLILDRASADFVKELMILEIPELFEGIVEIKAIARSPGYKTKVAVSSKSPDIDPVGTCIGLGGSRIKPILNELNGERIDVIEWTTDLKRLVKEAMKPAEVERVELETKESGEARAVVYVDEEQRSKAIGKGGKNIQVASMLCGCEIELAGSLVENGPSDGGNQTEGEKETREEMAGETELDEK